MPVHSRINVKSYLPDSWRSSNRKTPILNRDINPEIFIMSNTLASRVKETNTCSSCRVNKRFLNIIHIAFRASAVWGKTTLFVILTSQQNRTCAPNISRYNTFLVDFGSKNIDIFSSSLIACSVPSYTRLTLSVCFYRTPEIKPRQSGHTSYEQQRNSGVVHAPLPTPPVDDMEPQSISFIGQ